jgi:iron complex transport system ATP-binding protein
MSELRVDGLGVRRGRRTVLDGVDLAVPPGGWTVLLGPNGAGKSTLLRAIVGLVPHRGSVLVGGTDVRTLTRRALARTVALVPQQPQIPHDMTVREYVLLGRTPHVSALAVETGADHAVVAGVVARLDLHGLADRRLRHLSGGELQRAVLGRALAQEAPVLLLDEPTTSLDLGHVQQVLELVDELRRERGLTVLAAMHDLTLAAQYGDAVTLLDAGRVVTHGSPDDVLHDALVRRVFGAHVHVGRDDRGGLVVVPTRRGAP